MKEETPAEQIARGQMMISDGCALRDQGTAIMKSEEEFERGQKMVFAGESMVMLGHAHIRSAEREIHAQRTDLQRAIFREDKGGARKLLSDGADPNEVSDADQNPPLRIAFKNNLLALMRTLLAKGADPNIEANPGLPLLHAILRTHDLRLLASMLKAGADPDATGKEGTSVDSVIEVMQIQHRTWRASNHNEADALNRMIEMISAARRKQIEKAAKRTTKSKKRVGL